MEPTEVTELNEIEQIEKEIVHFESISSKAKLIKEFMDSPVYDVFDEVYLKGYRETSAMNVATFNVEQTANYVHHIKARAIFETFLGEMLIAGQVADGSLEELAEALKEAKKAQDTVEG